MLHSVLLSKDPYDFLTIMRLPHIYTHKIMVYSTIISLIRDSLLTARLRSMPFCFAICTSSVCLHLLWSSYGRGVTVIGKFLVQKSWYQNLQRDFLFSCKVEWTVDKSIFRSHKNACVLIVILTLSMYGTWWAKDSCSFLLVLMSHMPRSSCPSYRFPHDVTKFKNAEFTFHGIIPLSPPGVMRDADVRSF